MEGRKRLLSKVKTKLILKEHSHQIACIKPSNRKKLYLELDILLRAPQPTITYQLLVITNQTVRPTCNQC